jgi:hypothetical protein
MRFVCGRRRLPSVDRKAARGHELAEGQKNLARHPGCPLDIGFYCAMVLYQCMGR